MTSLTSSEDINWNDLIMYEQKRGPEFMKEINSPRAQTQRRASLSNLRRRSSSVVSMATASLKPKTSSSNKTERKSKNDVNHERQEENSEENKTVEKSTDENIRKNTKNKVVMEEITESEKQNKIKTKHDSDDIADEYRGISGAVNRAAQKNHGYISGAVNGSVQKDQTDKTDKSKNEVTNSNSDPDDILAQITAQINKLAAQAPDWLTEVLHGNVTPPTSTNEKPRYKRLAHRAGGQSFSRCKITTTEQCGVNQA